MTLLAYIDPGTGSFLLQVILAGVLGAGVAFKIFWAKIVAAFSFVSRKRTDD